MKEYGSSELHHKGVSFWVDGIAVYKESTAHGDTDKHTALAHELGLLEKKCSEMEHLQTWLLFPANTMSQKSKNCTAK